MRSVAEIDKDIAEVQAQIAARNSGTPDRNNPEYRAARFDYIVEGDRSGLDAYQNALNAAIQNKLSRESAEKMAQSGKEQVDEENEIQWRKDMTNARSDLNDVRQKAKEGKATQKDLEDAVANYNFHAERGAKKGYKNAPANESVQQEDKNEATLYKMAQDFQKKVNETVKKESSTIEELKAARVKADFLAEQGADMSDVYAALDDKINKLEGPVAMEAAMGELKTALESKNPDAIEAAAANVEKFSKVQGYKGDEVVKARKSAETIRKNAKAATAKAKAGAKVTKSQVLAANAKGEKQVQYKDADGTKYNFNYQFVNDQPQIFYGGKWNEVK